LREGFFAARAVKPFVRVLGQLSLLTLLSCGPGVGTEPSALAVGRLTPQVIYGGDSRHEVFEETDPRVRQAADATVALILEKDLLAPVNGTHQIRVESYRDFYRLCPEERFVTQGIAAFCSGALIGPDLVMTAGHCVSETGSDGDPCKSTAFVFDFNIRKRGDKPERVPVSSVYHCKEIVSKSFDHADAADYALVRLDRPVTDRKPLTLREGGSVAAGDELFVIGHPSGLPAKIASGAKVREVNTNVFTANLDTFSGNSGSPVFNAKTFEIEGILVAGETDYVPQGSCNVSKACSDDSCRGEDVTPVSVLLKNIPKNSSK
jgi:V8-like Glu-specific endopeptidase